MEDIGGSGEAGELLGRARATCSRLCSALALTVHAYAQTRALAGPSTADDLEELRVAWTNERFAPELLPHQDELVRRVRAAVDEQVRSCFDAHGPAAASSPADATLRGSTCGTSIPCLVALRSLLSLFAHPVSPTSRFVSLTSPRTLGEAQLLSGSLPPLFSFPCLFMTLRAFGSAEGAHRGARRARVAHAHDL